MKDSHYNISLHIIVPIIFSGFAVLSSILTFRLSQYAIRRNLDPGDIVFWAIVILSIVGFLCGFLIVWLILKPMRDFIRNTRSVLPERKYTNEKKPKGELEEWDSIFKQVTVVLSMVDAKQLFPEIIAESEIMRAVLSQITKVAPTDSTVLITGESGTGKEMIATSIYKQSLRKDKPFIKLNCVAIAAGLWESELFGHEKGSFTGATAKKPGKFELANEGTLFLDEIGDMPLETQAKMLRVLQEKEFERVGGTRTIKVDVRFIAATNKDLKKMVEEGTFREDLFFRLNVFYINVPPLRDRKDDIPVLVDHFCRKAPKNVHVSPLALQMLMENSSWPGNVRELHNIIERAAIMCDGNIIEPNHLPESIVKKGIIPNMSLTDSSDNFTVSIDDHLSSIEKTMIIHALRKTRGMQVKAAKLLGINQRSLWHRIRKHQIDAKNFRE